jgi:hypothetical protein
VSDELELEKLQRELDQYTMPADPTPTSVRPIELDDATIALAEQAAKTPWYASWVTGVLIPGGPALGLMMGVYGGSTDVQTWSVFAVILLFIFGPVIGLIWLALFTGHRSRVKYIRKAIGLQRAWGLTGPLDRLGRRTILAGNRALELGHHFQVPDWARTAQCTVIFADANVGADQDSASATGAVIAITGPDGRQIYPRTGAVPTLFQVPVLIASILVSLAFTAACNAQSQTYGDAALRMNDINWSVECTAKNKPGDDCWNWVAGTIAWDGGSLVTSGTESTNSSCHSMLRWGNQQQVGYLRIDGIDCTKQLSRAPMPARLQVLRDYAFQVQVGQSIYKTDKWPPFGDSIFTLALIFKLAVVGWVAWPIIHIAAALLYRLRQAIPTSVGS